MGRKVWKVRFTSAVESSCVRRDDQRPERTAPSRPPVPGAMGLHLAPQPAPGFGPVAVWSDRQHDLRRAGSRPPRRGPHADPWDHCSHAVRRLPNRLGGAREVGRSLRQGVLRRVDVLWINDPVVGVHSLTDVPALYDVTDDWREALAPETRGAQARPGRGPARSSRYHRGVQPGAAAAVAGQVRGGGPSRPQRGRPPGPRVGPTEVPSGQAAAHWVRRDPAQRATGCRAARASCCGSADRYRSPRGPQQLRPGHAGAPRQAAGHHHPRTGSRGRGAELDGLVRRPRVPTSGDTIHAQPRRNQGLRVPGQRPTGGRDTDQRVPGAGRSGPAGRFRCASSTPSPRHWTAGAGPGPPPASWDERAQEMAAVIHQLVR